MTPQERAVIDAAKKWGAAPASDCQAEARALGVALRALDALPADPEPAAVGETVVVLWTDSDGYMRITQPESREEAYLSRQIQWTRIGTVRLPISRVEDKS